MAEFLCMDSVADNLDRGSLPQNYMFREMRAALGIPKSIDILDHVHSLSNVPDSPSGASSGTATTTDSRSRSTVNDPGPPRSDIETLSHSGSVPHSPPASPQARAFAKIRAIERHAMTSQRPQPGLKELMSYLTHKGVRKALCTRNFPGPVHHLLSNHLPGEVFEPIITRETEGVRPKPSPEGLWAIAQNWGLHHDPIDGQVERDGLVRDRDPLELARQYLGSGLIMVGDSIDDMEAGHRAGAATVLLVNDENEDLAEHEYTDMTIRRLDDLIDVLEKGFQGRL